MVSGMDVTTGRLNLEDKLIKYIDKLIDKNMEESALTTDELELIIKYLKR